MSIYQWINEIVNFYNPCLWHVYVCLASGVVPEEISY